MILKKRFHAEKVRPVRSNIRVGINASHCFSFPQLKALFLKRISGNNFPTHAS